MSKRIVIIGAGPGGYVAAVRAAQKRAEVTVIEKENVGGTCLNSGCVPSKIMKTTADMVEKLGYGAEFGVDIDGSVSVNMGNLMKRKKKILDAQSKGILGLFSNHNIRYVKATACIKESGIVTAASADGTSEDIPYDNLILAMGTSPLNIPLFPFDGKKILSSNHLLSLTEIPESIIIVGGGVIGCEFAFILSALGSKVTVVEAMNRLLPIPSVDESCSKLIQREMKKRKINFFTDQAVDKVEDVGDKLSVQIGNSPFSDKEKKRVVVSVSKMAVCVGRASNAPGTGLEKIGVNVSESGWIQVNDRMETHVPGVYAIGDITGPERVMLAHVASTEGEVAVDNIMGDSREMKYNVIPGSIFTMPEIGNVGLSEGQAKEAGYRVRSDSVLFRRLAKAQILGELAGEAKIVSDGDTGKILGVHITGPHATDLIAEGVLAIQRGTTVKELADTIHAHPTLAEIMLEAAFKADDRPLHG